MNDIERFLESYTQWVDGNNYSGATYPNDDMNRKLTTTDIKRYQMIKKLL